MTEIEFLNLLGHTQKVFESSIDFPQESLDQRIWLYSGDEIVLQPDVKEDVFKLLREYPGRDLLEVVAQLHIVGSIGTNQYDSDTDIDVHLIPKRTSGIFGDEDFQKEVKKWYDEQGFKIAGHPFEVYIQFNAEQDLMSDACYDLLTGEWKSGPKVVPEDHDPYEDFSDIIPQVHTVLGDADSKLGQIKREVVDFKTIQYALSQMSPGQQQVLLQKMKQKLQGIEDLIHDLYSQRKEWVDVRRNASKPQSVEQARNDTELVKNWKDKNAFFKFIGRYNYMRVIGELERLLADGEITPDEVDKVDKIAKEL